MIRFIAAALIISATTFAATGSLIDNVTVYGGVNLNGEFKEGGDKINANKNGYTVGVEAHKQVGKFTYGKLELGLGTKYETSFKADATGDDTFATTLPLYGSAKLTVPVIGGANVYVQGSVGYVVPFAGDIVRNNNNDLSKVGGSSKLEGGLYTGVGAGVELGDLNVGVNYNISRVKEVNTLLGYNAGNHDYDYSKVSLTVGYKFDTKPVAAQ